MNVKIMLMAAVVTAMGTESAVGAPLEVVGGGVKLSWSRPANGDRYLALVPADVRKRIVVATIPGEGELPSFAGGSAQKGRPQYMQLYDRGVRLPLARWPKEGHAMIAETAATYDEYHPEKKPKTVAFKTGADRTRLEKWACEPDLWVWGAWKYGWDDATTPVLKVDPSAGTFEISTGCVKFGISKGYNGGGWYAVRNAFSTLSEPGEWVADRKARRIYMVEPVNGTDGITAALKEYALKLTGISDRVIEDKIFESCWGDAVTLQDCTNVVIRRCVIRDTGGWGVKIVGGRNCRVEGCDFYDIGEGGVSMRGGVRDTLEPAGHAVVNCHIRDYGRVIHNYRPGVSMSGVGCRAEHNLIHHARHSGVVFTGNDHVIAWNIIHDTCIDNYDCGGIYTYTMTDWWARGTVIEHNLVHMTGKRKHSDCTAGIYLDGFSSGVTVRDNIVSRATEGIFQNGGNDNVYVRNVLLACGKPVARQNLGLMGGTKPYPNQEPGVFKGRDSLLFKGLEKDRKLFESPLWKNRYPNMMRVFDIKDPVKAHNSFFSDITNNVFAWSGDPSYVDRDQMEGLQTITNNVELRDPGFRDFEGFDWSLRADASARKLIGGDTRFAEMGLYESPYRVSKSVKFGEGIAPALRHFDWPLPMPILRFVFQGDLPEGVKDYVIDTKRLCDMKIYYAKGNIWEAQCPSISEADGWKEFETRFTPTIDTTFSLVIRGWTGEKTVYDDFRVTGCEIANPDFETEGGWTVPKAWKTFVGRGYNTEPPCGIVGEETGVRPKSGKKMMVTNGFLVSSQHGIKVKKGVPVVIRFWARSFGR